MGFRRMRRICFYVPALSIFLIAASAAMVGCSGTGSRLSSGVAFPRAMLVTDLGRKMIAAGRWDTAGCSGFLLFSCPIHIPARRVGGAGWVRRNQVLCRGLCAAPSLCSADDLTFACFDRLDAAKRPWSRIDRDFLLRRCGLCTSIDQYGGVVSPRGHHQAIAAVS